MDVFSVVSINPTIAVSKFLLFIARKLTLHILKLNDLAEPLHEIDFV